MTKVLIAGGKGLIGSHLSALLAAEGYDVAHLSRRADGQSPYRTYVWNPSEGSIDPMAVQGADYIINLAGEGIADAPWTAARKEAIIKSRTDSARVLSDACIQQGHRPRAYLAASAVGYYGNRGEEVLPETARAGRGFLAESCIAWEEATAGVAASLQVRTFVLRIGIVLSSKGGALAKMITPAQLLVSPYFGDGQQWYPWIHIDDVARIFLRAITDERLAGTFNGVAPNPERNASLASLLPKAMGRVALSFPAPAFALRLALGEMSDVVLNSDRCVPQRLLEVGFDFKFPELQPALEDILRRKV